MATTSLTSRPAVWLRRYGPSELLSLAAVVLCSWATLELTGNLLLAAFAGSWAENLAYYGLLIGRELGRCGRLTARGALGVARKLLLEFGPAELLDSLFRPAALAAGIALAPTPAIGAVAGKLAADVLFYLPTIASYELLRRRGRPEPKETTR